MIVFADFTVLREGATKPEYKTTGSSGADLTYCPHPDDEWNTFGTSKSVDILPGTRVLLGTGISLALPVGFEGQVRPRSGLALKKGLTVLNSPGTIDSDYRGEVKIILYNSSKETATVTAGERIAQLVVTPVCKAAFTPVDEVSETERGEGGFGSTGT